MNLIFPKQANDLAVAAICLQPLVLNHERPSKLDALHRFRRNAAKPAKRYPSVGALPVDHHDEKIGEALLKWLPSDLVEIFRLNHRRIVHLAVPQFYPPEYDTLILF